MINYYYYYYYYYYCYYYYYFVALVYLNVKLSVKFFSCFETTEEEDVYFDKT